MEGEKKLLTALDIHREYGIGRMTAYALMDVLPVIRIGRKRVVRRVDLEAFLEKAGREGLDLRAFFEKRKIGLPRPRQKVKEKSYEERNG